jgi:hypothetical protein
MSNYVEVRNETPAPINVERTRDGRLRLHGVTSGPITLTKRTAQKLRDALNLALGKK